MTTPLISQSESTVSTAAEPARGWGQIAAQSCWNLLVLAILASCVLYVVVVFGTWSEYYGELLTRFPLYILIYLFLFSVVSGVFGRSFGLSNLFWHERWLPQLLAGAFLTILLTVMATNGYEILHDRNGDQVFGTMRELRDKTVAHLLRFFPSLPDTYGAGAYPVDVCEAEEMARGPRRANRVRPPGPALADRAEQARNYARLWHLVWLEVGKPVHHDHASYSEQLRSFVGSGENLYALPRISERFALHKLFVSTVGQETESVELRRRCGDEIVAIEGAERGEPTEAELRTWWDDHREARLDAITAIARAAEDCGADLTLPMIEERAGLYAIEHFRETHPNTFLRASQRAAETRIHLHLLNAVLPWAVILAIPWFWSLLDPELKRRFWRFLGMSPQAPEFGALQGAVLILGLLGTFVALYVIAPLAVSVITTQYTSLSTLWHPPTASIVSSTALRADAGLPLVSALQGFGGWLWQYLKTAEPISLDVLFETTAVPIATLLFLLAMAMVFRRARWVAPPVALCWILMFVAVAYGIVVHLQIFFNPIAHFAVVIGLGLLLLLVNRDPYKVRFPAFRSRDGDYYDAPRRTHLRAKGDLGVEDPAQARLDARGRASVQAPVLLDSETVLDRWCDHALRGGAWPGKPILVVVATTGGSIRAAIWTAKVLSKLEESPRLQGFSSSVRMITGASGGMLGAGVYVSLQDHPEVRALRADSVAQGMPPLSTGRLAVALLPRDSLSEPARRFALHDIPGMLTWWSRETDRGQALEEEWERTLLWKLQGRRKLPRNGNGSDAPILFRPFRELAESEATGARPSLVFTPMMVEDGKRLIISNLDLRHLTENAVSALNTGIFSQSALEFYRLFPDANDFRLSTAIRMSATFPFISPAVSLPTDPPRRIVDAGYYDNYGVNTAAMWLDYHRQWLADNTSGVLLVQVRAFPERTVDERSEAILNGLSMFSSPAKAVMQARQSVMSYRNDEQLEVLSSWFQKHAPGPEFFQTVTFTCASSASLSWHITRDEREGIVRCFEDDPRGGTAARLNAEHLEQLEQWWTRRRIEREI